jgi:threonine/homoserine/homoserine lactone efflux protein
MLYQIISRMGAVLVLAGYVALQRGWLAREDRAFNLLNCVGAAVLTWVAIEDRRAGFIILEGAWALLSLPGTIRRRRPG